MRATLRVRDLLIVSWETDRERVRDVLPAGLEAADVDGRHLVSIVAFHVEGGRVGRLPVAPFAQLNVRTYVTWKDEPAVFFLGARVSTLGLPARILGAPFRHARLSVRAGSVHALGLGLALVYRMDEPADAGLLGRHELGLFEARGLRGVRLRRGAAEWRRAVLTEPPRADVLLALGFETHREPELIYAEAASFETEVPPRRLE